MPAERTKTPEIFAQYAFNLNLNSVYLTSEVFCQLCEQE